MRTALLMCLVGAAVLSGCDLDQRNDPPIGLSPEQREEIVTEEEEREDGATVAPDARALRGGDRRGDEIHDREGGVHE